MSKLPPNQATSLKVKSVHNFGIFPLIWLKLGMQSLNGRTQHMYLICTDFSMLTGQTGPPPNQPTSEKHAQLNHFSTNLVETRFVHCMNCNVIIAKPSPKFYCFSPIKPASLSYHDHLKTVSKNSYRVRCYLQSQTFGYNDLIAKIKSQARRKKLLSPQKLGKPQFSF